MVVCAGKKSMTTSERMLLRNSGPAPDTAPRLPPKPGRELILLSSAPLTQDSNASHRTE